MLGDIRQIIEQARGWVQQAVNRAMVEAYWQIGRLIVEDEQQGGKIVQSMASSSSSSFRPYFLKNLEKFDISNLRRMRALYLAFPIRDAVRLELSWTHYRALFRLENPQARAWYMQEAIEHKWSGAR